MRHLQAWLPKARASPAATPGAQSRDVVRRPLCSVSFEAGLLSQMSGLHLGHTGLETSAAGTRWGVWYRWRWAKGSGLPLSRVDGFIEPPVTRQPAAACTVIWPEDEVLFNNCLTTIEVLRTLEACRRNSTCPEITLYLCASPLLPLFSGQQPTDTAWAQVETSLSAYQYTSLSVILHPRKSSLWGGAAGGWVSVHAAFRGRCFNLPDARRCH